MMKLKKKFIKLIKFQVIMFLSIKISLKFRMIEKKTHFHAIIYISKNSNIFKFKLTLKNI